MLKFPKHKCPMKLEAAIQVTGKCTYYGDPNILVCRLVTEESGKSEVLDRTFSGGLCGIVSVSESGANSDWFNRHSATDVGAGSGTTSRSVLFGNASVALGGMSFSCVVVSTPFVSDFDNEGTSRGLSKPVGGSVRRHSNEASESNGEKDD